MEYEEDLRPIDICPESTATGQLKDLRACLACSLVKTKSQFLRDGCQNCEEFLEMKGDETEVEECTSSNFQGCDPPPSISQGSATAPSAPRTMLQPPPARPFMTRRAQDGGDAGSTPAGGHGGAWVVGGEVAAHQCVRQRRAGAGSGS